MVKRQALCGALSSGACVVAIAIAGLAVPGAAHSASERRASGEAALNRRAAVHQAEARLDEVRFPRGSRTADELPPRIDELLSGLPYTFGSWNNVYRHDFWITPLAPVTLLHWIARHPPPGSWSAGSLAGSPPSPRSHEWEWGGGERVSGSGVIVSPVPYQGGSAVRLDSSATWVLPRPRAEHIPATARIVDLRIRPGDPDVLAPGGGEFELAPQPPTRMLRISNPREVHRLLRIVDHLRVVQATGVIHCPPLVPPVLPRPGEPASVAPPPSEIRLYFRTGRHQPALARIAQREEPGICNQMEVSVRGRPMPALEGGDELLRALLPQRARAR